MYFMQSEHNPPHIHAIYGEYTGSFDINTGRLLDGDLPTKASLLVVEWLGIHRDRLMDMWKTQQIEKLPPLI
jgi:hypothetical protein